MHHEIDFALLKTSQGTSEQTEKFWTSEAILKKKKKRSRCIFGYGNQKEV